MFIPDNNKTACHNLCKRQTAMKRSSSVATAGGGMMMFTVGGTAARHPFTFSHNNNNRLLGWGANLKHFHRFLEQLLF